MTISKYLSQKVNINSWFRILFYITLIVFSGCILERVFTAQGLLKDTYEHIHASWLISIGKVPYRDFFEHHHPLLWYIFAPVTQLFYRHIEIVYIARLIAALGYLSIIYLIYKITLNYTTNTTCAMLSVLFVLCIPQLWADAQNLRPDIFMYISILMGIIYFFDYLDTFKTRHLIFSYLSMFISFLFLQKAAFPIIGFIVVNLFLVCKGKIRFNDILLASLLPSTVCLCLLFLLYRTGTLDDWYLYNFTYNLIVKKAYGVYSAGIGFLHKIFILSAFIIVYFIKFKQLSSKSLCILCILFACMFSLLDYAPYPQYYFLYFVLVAIFLAPKLNSFYLHKPYALFTVFFFFLIISFGTLCQSQNSAKLKADVSLVNYLIKNTSPQDKLLNGLCAYNLFNEDTDFYWFGFTHAVIIADLYLDKSFDYNEQIKLHRPKFLMMNNMFIDYLSFHNSRWLRDRNTALLQKAARGDRKALSKMSDINIDYWQIDMEFVKKNYKLVDTFGSTELWERIENSADAVSNFVVAD